MELKEQLINDLNNSSFLYYPCCGMDFKIIPKFLNYFQTINEVRNFIFIDANNKNANSFTPIEFLGNKLGLAELEIVEKQTFKFDENFYSEVAQILNGFEQSESNNVNDFIKGIKKPKAIRFVLKNENTDFVLYYFYFEAVTIIEYINRLALGENFKGLLICAPGGGWTGYTELVTKLISVSRTQYIVCWNETPIPQFGKPIVLPTFDRLWISFKNDYGINSLEEANNVIEKIDWKKIK